MGRGFIVACVAGLSACGVASGEPEDGPHARASLIASSTSIAAGGTLRVGLRFEIDPGWHLYWNGRNDTGFEPQVRWELPEGWSISDLYWPAPERHISPGEILDHIYENEVTLVAELRAPEGASGVVSIGAEVSWLVCAEVCIPEDASVWLSLPVGAGASAGVDAAAFAAAEARWPVPAEAGMVERTWRGPTLTLEWNGSADRVAFFPAADAPAMEDAIRDTAREGKALTLAFTRDLRPIVRVAGVLEVESGGKKRWYTVDVTGPDVVPAGSGRTH